MIDEISNNGKFGRASFVESSVRERTKYMYHCWVQLLDDGSICPFTEEDGEIVQVE